MKFGFFTLGQIPKPLDKDTWNVGQEEEYFHRWLEQYQFADEVGFDYLWTGEHHYQSEYTHISVPDSFLAAVSQRTQNARLGTSIMHLSLTHNHPVNVAERASMLDVLSRGRLELGTGRASYNDGPHVYGDPGQEELIAKEGHEIWKRGVHEAARMMTEEPYSGYKDDQYDISPFTLVPRPVQKPHPPLWHPALSPDANGPLAQLGLGAANLTIAGPDMARAAIDGYWKGFHERVEPVGRAINPATAVYVFAFCAPTDEEAFERASEGMRFFMYAISNMGRDHTLFRHLNREFHGMEPAPEPRLPATGTTGAPNPFTGNVSADVLKTIRSFDPSVTGIVGSPETVAAKLREYEQMHTDILVMHQICGDIKHEHLLQSTELLATKVLPEFRDRQDQHAEWRAKQLAGVDLPVSCSA